MVICQTCGVEHPAAVEVCAICADERQWVPRDGQAWTTLQDLAEGRTVVMDELETDLVGITASPPVGIGHQTKLLRTPSGNLLWDPIGYLDDDAVARIRRFGPVAAIAASHPHMFGVQVEWSRRLDDPPVYVCQPNLPWVARADERITSWSGRLEPLPGVTLVQAGGHFPGSALVHFTGADGRGVVLSSDTVFVNPDRESVAFMRSFPNHIPQSPAVVARLVATLDELDYDRMYGNFTNGITRDAPVVVHRSAERHRAWVRGDFDERT